VAESGVPGYEATSWYGYLAPAGTPRRIIDQLVAELTRAVQSADMKERYNTLGIETYTGTPEQFGAYIQSEMAKWAEVVKKSGAKLE
jgi:tripartite-type tricarboxylate transporter receptor subunit TctC